MASPKRRRQKKEAAKGLRPKGVTKPHAPLQYASTPNNVVKIGGAIVAFGKPEEWEDRVMRAIRLKSMYDVNRSNSPWLRVEERNWEQFAHLSLGDRVCLAGRVRSFSKRHPKTHRSWDLFAERILCEGRTNLPGGVLACNRVEVKGLIVYRKSGLTKDGRPKYDVGMRCMGPDGVADLVEMTAYIVMNRLENWPVKRELGLMAAVHTYGALPITQIEPSGYI